MVGILRNKNVATRFQILAEIAAGQPDIQQKDIARRLNITPQAVSNYIKRLLKEGLLTSAGRSQYRVSNEGVDWMLRHLKELQEYFEIVGKAVSNIKVSAAIAGCNLSRGQTVGLVMREGLLFATGDPAVRVRGTAVSDAAEGDDVGITNIQGIISLEIGKVAILEVPGMQKGGSRNVDSGRLQRLIQGKTPVAVTGIEALVALKRTGIQPDCTYGAEEAVIEAASRGLSPVIVCVDEEVPTLIKRLEKANIRYRLSDLRPG
ncbi:MAG: winged helix-turn-helix transcriptional regulator [Chloroflexota bacterium]|nr:winged helix-turn-helix transcriptional regulator [Chloroflexota bacterium]